MLTTLDLFAGAGGFSLGMKWAGLECVGAIELDRFACSTYKCNFPTVPVHQVDLGHVTESWMRSQFRGVDVVIGGPPCQGFSVAGARQYGRVDPRNSLVLSVARTAKAVRPRFVVIENVRGIVGGALKNGERAIDAYLREMEKSGYCSKVVILQAADFGVPQTRQRAFIISAAAKGDLQLQLQPQFQGPENWRTVEDAISDLPTVESGAGLEEAVAYRCAPQNAFQKLMRRNSNGVFNHVSMRHAERSLARFRAIMPGQSLVHAPPELGQRARNSGELDARQRFKMNNTRLRLDRPSGGITACYQGTFLHPTLHRVLTAREGARLQSFPDAFIFTGPRTLMSRKLLKREGREDEIGLSQYNQVGNAVPPLLARAVGKALERRASARHAGRPSDVGEAA